MRAGGGDDPRMVVGFTTMATLESRLAHYTSDGKVQMETFEVLVAGMDVPTSRQVERWLLAWGILNQLVDPGMMGQAGTGGER